MFDETDVFRRGVALLEKNSFQEALQAFDEALRLNPKYVEAYYSRAITRENQNNLE